MPSLPIVGARFRPPAQEVLQLLPANYPLILRREPENPYDENAIKVLMCLGTMSDETSNNISHLLDEDGPTELHLGYIPREIAAKMAPLMDQRYDEETLVVRDIEGKLAFGIHGGPMVSFEDHQE